MSYPNYFNMQLEWLLDVEFDDSHAIGRLPRDTNLWQTLIQPAPGGTKVEFHTIVSLI